MIFTIGFLSYKVGLLIQSEIYGSSEQFRGQYIAVPGTVYSTIRYSV